MKFWEIFRAFLNTRGLLKLVEGNIFGTVMLIITITNCILIIAAFFIEDLAILDVFNTLDTVFLAVYTLECSIKIIALGIRNYFDEGWNVFDISLVLL